MNKLVAEYKRSWIDLVEAHADELREFALSMYDSNVHIDDAWFEYTIDDVEVDINVYVVDALDDATLKITIYPIEGCSTITNMQVDL
jgi:hypothetical protein